MAFLPYPRHPLKSSHGIHRIHRSFWRRIFSHGFHRIHRSFWRRIFSHRFHGSTQKLVSLMGCTCLRSALPLARARSAPTEPTCHLFCLCSRDSCTPWLAAWVWQGCHTLLICAHPCLSVGGFLCQKVLCVPRILWELSPRLLCWERGSILPTEFTEC